MTNWSRWFFKAGYPLGWMNMRAKSKSLKGGITSWDSVTLPFESVFRCEKKRLPHRSAAAFGKPGSCGLEVLAQIKYWPNQRTPLSRRNSAFFFQWQYRWTNLHRPLNFAQLQRSNLTRHTGAGEIKNGIRLA
jgi:hypothetical protein